MSETKFTPGPWRIDKDTFAGRVEDILTDDYHTFEAGNGTKLAGGFSFSGFMSSDDAYLIAAAPDIYDALVKAREVLRHITYREDHLGDVAKDAAIKADAALAKARGETP